MLKTIITREFLNNILNLRFIIGLVLCIIVTITCIVILTHDYQQKMTDYNLRINAEDDFISNYGTSFVNLRGSSYASLHRIIHPQKPPERFRTLIIGIPGKEELESIDDNPLPVIFPPFDFLFIVTIIMSLLAILFSYDAITGERQSGTLRLVIANSISRTTILFAKFVGGTASLIIPFILSLLIGVLYVSINPAIQWDSSAWMELALLTAASITFITLFYLLGLMVSTFSRYSSTSILNCLFLWVLLILVIPNISPYISAQLYRIPSIQETKRKELETEILSIEVGKKLMKESVKQYRIEYGTLFTEFESMEFGGISSFFLVSNAGPEHKKAARQRADADPEFKAMMDAFKKEPYKVIKEVERIRNEFDNTVWKDLYRKAAVQTKLAKNMACISPFANFVYIARDLTGTGLRSLKYFEQIEAEYKRQLLSNV
jgi:ABC-type transport system involved in multi-copper enzyme maturation permease subunit